MEISAAAFHQTRNDNGIRICSSTFNDISGFLVFKPHNIYKHRYFQITLEAHSENHFDHGSKKI